MFKKLDIHQAHQRGRRDVEKRIFTIANGLVGPIGRCRKLINGDRQNGKTAVAIDTIVNQKQSNDYVDAG